MNLAEKRRIYAWLTSRDALPKCPNCGKSDILAPERIMPFEADPDSGIVQIGCIACAFVALFDTSSMKAWIPTH